MAGSVRFPALLSAEFCWALFRISAFAYHRRQIRLFSHCRHLPPQTVRLSLHCRRLPSQRACTVSSLIQGLLVPFCTYVIVAVALNLTVGILGELSLGPFTATAHHRWQVSLSLHYCRSPSQCTCTGSSLNLLQNLPAQTFAIGSMLASVAGVLLCSAYPSLTPYTGSMPGIKAFVAAVFGGKR